MVYVHPPSSPAADADLSPRWWRNLRLTSVRTHLRRASIVAAAVIVVGSLVSGYLALVGVRLGDAPMREIYFYPFTVQMRSDIHYVGRDSRIPTGLRREWHPTGKLWIEGSYSNGARVGTWQEWYPDGTLRFEGTYKNDLLYGTETWFYPDGKKEWEIGRVAGVRDGEERWWHGNGEIRRAGRYREGRRDGTFSVFGESGELSFRGEYRAGDLVEGAGVD